MNKTLALLSKICLVVMMVGGFVVTFGQVIGIIIGDGPMIQLFGENFIGPVSAIAGLGALFAFGQFYTKEGKAAVQKSDIDTDEAGA